MKQRYILSTLAMISLSTYSSAFSLDRPDALTFSEKRPYLPKGEYATSSISKPDTLPNNVPVIYLPNMHKNSASSQDAVQPKKSGKSKVAPTSSPLLVKKSKLSKALAKSAVNNKKLAVSKDRTFIEEGTKSARKLVSSTTGTDILKQEKGKKSKNIVKQNSVKTAKLTRTVSSFPKAQKSPRSARVIAATNTRPVSEPATTPSYFSQETNNKQAEKQGMNFQTQLAKSAPLSKRSEKAPLDGGVTVLLAAGAAAGIRKAYLKRKESRDKMN